MTKNATKNGDDLSDKIALLLSNWTKKPSSIIRERSDLYKGIDGKMVRPDIFVGPGVLKFPYDEGLIIECKSQSTGGTAFEKVYKNYMNAVFRAEFSTLFVCKGEVYRTFVNFVNSNESKLIVGSNSSLYKKIEAVLGIEEFVNWFNQGNHRILFNDNQ